MTKDYTTKELKKELKELEKGLKNDGYKVYSGDDCLDMFRALDERLLRNKKKPK